MSDTVASEFPMYLMRVDNVRRFMPIGRAGAVFDSGLQNVEIDGQVLESDFTIRPITDTERLKIRDIADACSASK